MSQPTAQEVMTIALINRARLDPAGEAARYGIDLNEGLQPGTLGAASRQPLAFNASLFAAADAHSQAMIDSDYFAHNDPNTGSSPQSRGTGAGYSGGVGENIAFRGSTGAIDATATIIAQHQDLFVDDGIAGRGHRTNFLDDRYQEIGVGQVIGLFTQNGSNFNSSMLTEDFGIPSASGQFLTGLVYTDTDANAFYSVGEGRGGVSVAIAAGNQITGTAGAYSGAIGSGGQAITFSGGGLAAAVSLTATILAGRNALINLVGASTVETSVSINANANLTGIIGLGTNGLTLNGNALANKIAGTSGNDIIDGGAGVDIMTGGAGNDIYIVDNAGDQVIESVNGGSDTLYTSVNYTLPANVEVMVLQGGADLQVNGSATANTIYGNAGSNIIDGGAGADILIGGAGNDIYIVDNVNDQVAENAGEGNDTLYTSVNYTLPANVEVMVLQGSADLQVSGSALANTIYGNAGNNIIDGGGGADILIGGAGNDVYIVDNVNDQVVESAGQGSDTLYTSVNYTLPANVEVMLLQGSANLQVNGNALANTIYGNSGNNIIDGSGGADILIGGAGNDIYIVDNAGDQVIESVNGGSDTLYTSVNYTLSANVEVMVLQGVAGLQVIGNALTNTIYGNAGNNVVDGGGGTDILVGGGGSDRFVFHAGQASGDTIVDFAGNNGAADTLEFYGFGNTGQGAAFTQLNASQWQIHSGMDGHNEIIGLAGNPVVTVNDYHFF